MRDILLNKDLLTSQKNTFENSLIDLSQAASVLSDHMLVQTKINSGDKINSIHLDSNQLSALHNIIDSIDSLSNVYQNLYGQSVKTCFDEKSEKRSHLRKSINQSLLKSQENERQRIAADLHDSVVQNLVHLSQQIEIIQMCMDKDIISSKLELAEMKKNIKTIISEIRNTIFNLRPMTFDDIGWDAAFVQLKEMIEMNSDCSVLLEIDKPIIKEQLYLITIYRIIREACINAMKHANASEIIIKIHNEKDFVHILVQDNGIGFTLEDVSREKTNHFGLNVIRERVLLLSGDFHIITDHGNGTKIKINIPI